MAADSCEVIGYDKNQNEIPVIVEYETEYLTPEPDVGNFGGYIVHINSAIFVDNSNDKEIMYDYSFEEEEMWAENIAKEFNY